MQKTNRKKRILFVTESHKLASGFGTYAKHVIPKIHATGKYEIAQVVCYASPESFENTEWLMYGVQPMTGEDDYAKQSNNPMVQWGVGRFEHACLDFKPDIVVCWRDPWMDAYIADSPFLPFFNWCWMPTVDSAPQKTEWIYNYFNRCDTLLAYSEYGIRTLEEQTKGRVCPVDIAPPGTNPALFDIIPNKAEHKKRFNLPEDSYIVGTVMRNQKRKMFPELMRAFKEFRDKTDRNAYLYLHTSYPEKAGWNLTNLMHEFDLGSSLLTTYKCKFCKKFFVATFRDAITTCNHCGQYSSVMPSVSFGVDREELKDIYNLMDIYVQYAICEGFGMPQVEAAACGVPLASTYYSAMEDVIDTVGGYPIPPNLIREVETNADRSGPNTEALVDILLKHSRLKPEAIQDQRLTTRQKCIKKYNWDNAAAAWCKAFDNVDLSKNLPWDHQPLLKPMPKEMPQGLTNQQFAEWVELELVQDQYHCGNYRMINNIKSLNFGSKSEFGNIGQYTQENLYEEMKHVGDRRAFFDSLRSGNAKLNPQPFVVEAHRRIKR